MKFSINNLRASIFLKSSIIDVRLQDSEYTSALHKPDSRILICLLPFTVFNP